jgi:hypothetical protein
MPIEGVPRIVCKSPHWARSLARSADSKIYTPFLRSSILEIHARCHRFSILTTCHPGLKHPLAETKKDTDLGIHAAQNLSLKGVARKEFVQAPVYCLLYRPLTVSFAFSLHLFAVPPGTREPHPQTGQAVFADQGSLI